MPPNPKIPPPVHFSRFPFSGYVCVAVIVLSHFLCLATGLAAPVAPSNLRGTVITSTSLFILWDDNSTDETSWDLTFTVAGGGSSTWSIDSGTVAGTGPTNIGLNAGNFGIAPNTNYTFKISAVNGSGPSAYSNQITIKTAELDPPGAISATAFANGNVLLQWVDNAYSEAGFSIEVQENGGAWSVLGALGANSTLVSIPGLAPSTLYGFRLRAYIGAGPTYSGYSNTVSVTTPVLATPTGLTAAALAPTETSVSLAYTDQTAANTGYEIYYRISGSGGGFVSYGSVPDGNGANLAGAFEPGTAYEFQVRAYFQYPIGDRSHSSFSDPTTITTAFKAPTALVAVSTSETQVALSWTDNSVVNVRFTIYARLSGSGSYSLVDITSLNATTYNMTGLAPGTVYDFQVAAIYQPVLPRTTLIESTRATATATTRDGFTSASHIVFGTNNAYTYTATTSTASARTSFSASNLPNGMNFDANTGVITGTPTQFGHFTATLSATFANGWASTKPLTLRIVRPPGAPVTGATITGPTLNAGGGTGISLTDKFSDPDAESAVRVNTNQGIMDFILFNSATPQTVTNFLSYANAGTNNFNGAVFHRSVPGFVIQGGAFKVASGTNNFSVTPTSPAVVNEPGISNLRGTVAMAKLGGNPNSATNQFFVNLNDNSSNLDNQNGGFSAFARVAGNGMNVADTIAGLPRGDYDVNLGSSATTMEDWPLTSASVEMDTNLVVAINSVAPVPVLSHSVTGNSNPTAVSAVISGDNVQIDGLAGGQSDITVTATDLDGNTVHQTFTVTVNQAPAFTSGPPTSTGIKGSSYAFTSVTSGFPLPTYAVTAGALPTGLMLSNGGAITETPTAVGVFTGTITATNSQGSVTQNFTITINEILANWAAGKSLTGSDALPTADPDHDGRTNLLEFGLLTEPGIPDGNAMPSYALVTVGVNQHGEITFPARKFAPSLTYSVEASTSLAAGNWTTLWTTADGFGASTVTSAVSQSDRTVLTVRDLDPSSAHLKRLLRVRITQ